MRVAPARELRVDIIRAQIRPADHTENPRMLRGMAEECVRLAETVPRLHRDAAVDTVLIEQGLQIARQKIPLQRAMALVDPRVILRGVSPEMLMGIHPQGRCRSAWVSVR